jgi:hypothetical protein
MIVVDPTLTCGYDFDAKDMVRRIKNSKAYDRLHRNLVPAYIDIGEAEEWRWYWEGHPTYEELGECRPQYVRRFKRGRPGWWPLILMAGPATIQWPSGIRIGRILL